MANNSIKNRELINYKKNLDEEDTKFMLMGSSNEHYDEEYFKNNILNAYSRDKNPIIQRTREIVNSMDGFFSDSSASVFFEGNFSYPVPGQGWKVHISAKDFEHYMKLCEDLVPCLNASKIPYKIVNPLRFKDMESHPVQHGKYITIYAGDAENLHNLLSALPSDTLKEVLNSDTSAVAGEISVGGGIFARYGSFVSDYYIVAPNGAVVEDERGVACPEWINKYDFIKKSMAPITEHMSFDDVAKEYFKKIDSWADRLCDWFCGHQDCGSKTSLYDIGNACVGLGSEFNDIYDMISGNRQQPPQNKITTKDGMEV